MAEEFDELPLYVQREWARLWIAQEMDFWQWEEECRKYWHIRHAPTATQYRTFLRETRMQDIFKLAGY